MHATWMDLKATTLSEKKKKCISKGYIRFLLYDIREVAKLW